eukprot:7063692-Ditylum_brightwellii.AAC.1
MARQLLMEMSSREIDQVQKAGAGPKNSYKPKAFGQDLLISSKHNTFSNLLNWRTGQWTTKEMDYSNKLIAVLFQTRYAAGMSQLHINWHHSSV